MLLLAMLLVPCSPCLDPAAALLARTCCLPALDEGVDVAPRTPALPAGLVLGAGLPCL